MTNSDGLIGQLIIDSRQILVHEIRESRAEYRRGFQHLSRRIAMEKPRDSPDITAMEKWIVRLATIGLPTGTFFLTGSWEKALQMFFQLAK
jgi:hypothetical protein